MMKVYVCGLVCIGLCSSTVCILGASSHGPTNPGDASQVYGYGDDDAEPEPQPITTEEAGTTS